MAVDKGGGGGKKRKRGQERSWQRGKEGAQRRDSRADTQLDEHKAPVSAGAVCACVRNTGVRSEHLL